MKTILLFGAGKSATVLIDYLLGEAPTNNWRIIIADVIKEQILSKTNNSPFAEAIAVNVLDSKQRSELIKRADIVISMMPPALHFLIAQNCVEYGRNLLTASYLDDSIRGLKEKIDAKKLLFICEMGLDPGIDHMSAMKLIDHIKTSGGVVTSFKSHCGGLVAPESDDNPWHYKISWNPRNVVMAGKAGAEYKLNNKIHYKEYKELFNDCSEVDISGLGNFAFYPNRDSLSYMPVYRLENVETFLRSTLRYPAFCVGWNAIVQAGLTDDTAIIQTNGLTFRNWSASIVPFVNDSNKIMLVFLGLFEEELVPFAAKTSADILQWLLETKLAMRPDDKDMIVMLHEIEYLSGGVKNNIESSLVVTGEDSLRTAMAKTVGLPLGIAAKFILNGTIQLAGIHIPTIKQIYDPVLNELEKSGICFIERQV